MPAPLAAIADSWPKSSGPAPLVDLKFENNLTNDGSDTHTWAWVEAGNVTNPKTGNYTAGNGSGYAASFDGSTGMAIPRCADISAALGNITTTTILFDFYLASFASKRALWLEGTWGILFDDSSHIYFYNVTSGTNWPSFTLGITLSTNTWYTLKLTYDNPNNQIKLYIDGTQRGSTSSAYGTFAANANNSLYVGSDGTNGNNCSGRIDNLKIYSTVV